MIELKNKGKENRVGGAIWSQSSKLASPIPTDLLPSPLHLLTSWANLLACWAIWSLSWSLACCSLPRTLLSSISAFAKSSSASWILYKEITAIGWLIYWLIDRLISLIDWLICWLIDWLIDWFDWLIDWLIDRLIDWLIDWLTKPHIPVE